MSTYQIIRDSHLFLNNPKTINLLILRIGLALKEYQTHSFRYLSTPKRFWFSLSSFVLFSCDRPVRRIRARRFHYFGDFRDDVRVSVGDIIVFTDVVL